MENGLVVRVLVEGTIDKEFDYLVPEELQEEVRVGTQVRVQLGGRRVGGWVVETDTTPDTIRELKPIAKVRGWGPDRDVVDLARWAAHRWAGRVANLLTTASPPTAVRELPTRSASRSGTVAGEPVDDLAREAFAGGVRVLQLPPAEDLLPVVLEAARLGNALVVVPSIGSARQLAGRLRRAGGDVALYPRDWAKARAGATVVGARAAAWAPLVSPAAFVLIDEHDEVHQEERVPTWNARDVLIERARRAGVPCVLTSPMPTLEARRLRGGTMVLPSTSRQRAGWAIVDVADRRQEDPRRAGLFSPALVKLLRSEDRVACVLNRKGRARLLACSACGEVARCERCAAAVAQLDTDYECLRCGTTRPAVCQSCGAIASRNIRAGVARVREELEALVREPVGELTGSSSTDADARVTVGTEALLHHLADLGGRDVRVVAFIDFDQELLAPRYRAAEQALGLLCRASRLVGSRRRGGRVLVQTRQPDHEVMKAAVLGDPDRLVGPEMERRQMLGFPPVRSVAEVSGAAAAAFIEALGSPLGVEVVGPRDGSWLIKAPDAETLADTLAAVDRPAGRLRLAVDPLRV